MMQKCTIDYEGKELLFTISPGQPHGRNLSRSTNEVHVTGKNCRKILDLLEEDGSNYCCLPGMMQFPSESKTLKFKCNMKKLEDGRTYMTSVLISVMVMAAVLIIFLTFLVIRGNKKSNDMQVNLQADSLQSVAPVETVQYSQVTIKQAKKNWVNRKADNTEYASVRELFTTYSNSEDLSRQTSF
ncbi:uncharacterized protein LOC134346122 isoform X2 [Mobula hypostoma]